MEVTIPLKIKALKTEIGQNGDQINEKNLAQNGYLLYVNLKDVNFSNF